MTLSARSGLDNQVESDFTADDLVHYTDLDGSCVPAGIVHAKGHEAMPCLLIFFPYEHPRLRHCVPRGRIGQFATWHPYNHEEVK